MKAFFVFLAKIGIILYLASQAFVDYDLIVLIGKWLTGQTLAVPYGLNASNTIAFVLAAVFIARKEWGRSKQISYLYSPESVAKMAKEKDAVSATDFGSLLESRLHAIVGQSFPPMIPLQFSDVLTTKGFELHEEDDADGVLQYVEELSPLEVATNAVLGWLRQEAQFRRFRLELHSHQAYEAVAINSGNPDTNAYLCWEPKSETEPDAVHERLAREAALRMFFESESQICRNFEAFKRFYQFVENLPELYRKYGYSEFDAVQTQLIKEIDGILEADPRFLTMQVLKGIVCFHNVSKSLAAFNQAEGIFLEAIEDAKRYNRNRRRSLRRAFLPEFLRGSKKETTSEDEPEIALRTMLYVQGLSEVFLGRIFAQNAHRFGSFDADPKRFLALRKKSLRRLNRGIRYLSASSSRFPRLAKWLHLGYVRVPMAYQVKGLLNHCHDYFDRDEVDFRRRRKGKGVSDAERDLNKAVAVYSKGIHLCGTRKIGGTAVYTLHTCTRISNNCGYALLYESAIRGKRRGLTLRSLPEFERAEFRLCYSGFETRTFFGYPLANLGLLYALEGDWERSWKAGVAALDNALYNASRQDAREPRESLEAWAYTPDKVGHYRAILDRAARASGLQRPTLEEPYAESWKYVEGISELSYGFLFRSLVEAETHAGNEYRAIGLRIHRRALDRFLDEECGAGAELRESIQRRIRNIMTNLIRAFWHFDDRANAVDGALLEEIYETLHTESGLICESWEESNLEGEAWEAALRGSVDDWMSSLKRALG